MEIGRYPMDEKDVRPWLWAIRYCKHKEVETTVNQSVLFIMRRKKNYNKSILLKTVQT